MIVEYGEQRELLRQRLETLDLRAAPRSATAYATHAEAGRADEARVAELARLVDRMRAFT